MLDDDVPQVLVGLADVHALDGLGCLTGVLMIRQRSVIYHNNTEYNISLNETHVLVNHINPLQKSFQ